jgi:hypothetical protein
VAEPAPERKAPGDHVNELKTLVVGYAKQETIDPLRHLGKYLGFGAAGSILIGLGSVFLLLALLRGVQAIGPFDGSTGGWSLLSYGITMIVGLIAVGIVAKVITTKKGSKP